MLLPFLCLYLICGSIASIPKTPPINLDKLIKNINNIMTAYNKELDQAVPFKELKASLVVLDSLANNYHGACSRDIFQASSLGYVAAAWYYEAIDSVFKWSVKAEDTCRRSILKFSDGKNVSSDSPLYFISTMLVTGLTEITESIKILEEEVRDKLTAMQRWLRPVPSKLESELNSIRWDYTRKRQERMRAFQEEEERIQAQMAIKKTSCIALGLLGGPVGAAFGLYNLLSDDIPTPVLDQRVEATAAQQLQITETFLRSLINAVGSTIKILSEVKDAVNKEITHLSAFKGNVDGQLFIVLEMEDYPKEELNELKTSVHDFITRHGGDSHKSRERREISDRGLSTWEEYSRAVDEYMDATAKQREMEFWQLKPFQSEHAIMNQFQLHSIF